MKSFKRSPFQFLALALSLHLTMFGLVQTAQAAVVTTDQFVAVDAGSSSHARVAEYFARDDVRVQLEALGVDPVDALERVSALTPEELNQLDQRIAEMPAGGDVIAVIGIVFVVLLVLELVGVTNIFNKF